MKRIQSYFDKRYYENEEQGPGLSPYIAHVILNELTRGHVQKVLDAGCGTGGVIRFLKDYGFEVYGIDISQQAAQRSRQIVASVTDLPFKMGAFDALISIHVVEHLIPRDFHKFLEGCYRVLRRHGILFIATPNTQSPTRLILGRRWYGHRDPTHINLIAPNIQKREMERAGFRMPRMIFKIPPFLVSRRNFGKWIMRYYNLNRLFGKCLWLQDLFMFLMVSTCFAYLRDTTWLCAKKS
jgi:SAM-dependent methyltransferase